MSDSEEGPLPDGESPTRFEYRNEKQISKKTPIVTMAVVAALALSTATALAAPTIDYDEIPLTQAELDANWEIDRAVPSGGFESLSFASRDDVLEMRVDPDNRSAGSGFFHTEGLIRQTPGADALRADLYIDPAWDGQDIRAGLWGVGHDDLGVRTQVFPIVEYHQDVAEGFAGWRLWDSSIGEWTPHGSAVASGDWATLEIVLDTDNDQFVVSVDGVPQVVDALGTTALGEVVVNMFNYGPGTPAYDVHVSSFAVGEVATTPATKDDCRKGGYADFGFKNQGQCIASLVSNK